jgi:hypothetical protein
MPRIGTQADGPLAVADRDFLFGLQTQALQYFLDNQTDSGLVLDRQANRGTPRSAGLCSLAATGMGCIAVALAAEPEYRLLPPATAVSRVRSALRTCLRALPADQGVLPHFVESDTGAVYGADSCSTVETAWVVAGALWAAASLRDAELGDLAGELAGRVHWAHWTRSDGLIRHGKDQFGQFFPCAWDRLNGETAFMYVLAAGADDSKCLAADVWTRLQPCYGTAAGLRFVSADLGLFVFQYGLDLLDFRTWRVPGSLDLWAEAAIATDANRRACQEAAGTFATYRQHWGLSAGDGPGDAPTPDTYRIYSPAGPIDGTAHLTATLASVAHRPGDVLDNLRAASRNARLDARGRYGLGNLNLDAGWVGTDMVGIDAGAAVLALDNYLHANRIRSIFHRLPQVSRGLDRLGFQPQLLAQQAA